VSGKRQCQFRRPQRPENLKRRRRTMSDLQAVFDYIDAHQEQYLADLQRLVRQPSVSAQGIGIAETAGMVEQMLAQRGFDVAQYPTSGNPIVFGERAGASS